MAYTEQDVRNIINSVESKYPTLPKGTLLKIHGIETAGDANKVNVNGGVSKSGAGAKGWFQFTDASAKLFGVDPTDLRSSADGAARHILEGLKRYGGNMELALVDYNGGPRAVKAYQSGKAFPESSGYVQKFFGTKGTEQAAPAPQPMVGGKPSNSQRALDAMAQSTEFGSQLVSPTGIESNDRTLELADAAAAASQKAIALEQQRNTAQEVIDYGVSQTLTAAMQDTFRPSDPNWRYGDTQAKQALAAGVANDQRFLTYVEAAVSQDDFDDRMEKVQGWAEIERKMNNESGLEFIGSQGLMMLGNMADPAAIAASVVAGAGLYAAGVRATTVAGRAAMGVAEGFASNVAVEAAIQSKTRTELSINDLIQQGVVGAGFSALGTVASTTARAVSTARKMRALGDEVGALANENLAADADAASKPLQSVTERRTTEALTDASEAQQHGPESVPDAFEATSRRPIGETARGERNPEIRALQREKAGTTGIEMSAEAAEVTRWSYEDVPDAGKAAEEMQARLKKWYDVRDSAIAKANANVWQKLDSIGLTLVRSTSPVVRKLASVLIESGTGIGRRETTVALAADQFNMNLQHKYVPNIITSMVQAMSPSEKAGFYTGWGSSGQNRIGREVAIYREAKRQAATRGEDMSKFQHNSSPEVKKVGDALDAMGMDIRDMMDKAGHPDADLLRGALATGYRQYQWNWRQLQGMIHDRDPMFNQFVSAVQSEFREQIVNPALADLRENYLPTLVDKHRQKLESRVEEVQGQLAELEPARRKMDEASDAVKETEQAVRDIRDQQKAIREAIKEIEENAGKSETPDPNKITASKMVKGDPTEGVWHEVTFGDGSTAKIQRLNATESMGLPGWHDITAEGENVFLGNTKAEAMRALEERRAKQQEVTPEVEPEAKPEVKETPEADSDVTPADEAEVPWNLGKDKSDAYRADRMKVYKATNIATDSVTSLLDRLIDDPDMPEADRMLARWLAQNGELSEVPVMLQYTRSGRSLYDPNGDFIVLYPWEKNTKLLHTTNPGEWWGQIDAQTKRVLLHEVMHARTSHIINRFLDGTLSDPKLIAACERLKDMQKLLKERFPNANKDTGIGYALTNLHEFASQTMNDVTVRRALNGIKVEGESLLRQFTRTLMELLGFDTKSTALTETMNALDSMFEQRSRLVSKEGDKGRILAPRKLSPAEVAKVAELRGQLKKLDAEAQKRMEAREKAKGAKQSVTGENVKKVNQLRMQLGKAQQELAEFQVPGGAAVVAKRMYDAFEKQQVARANSKASHYVRNIIQDADARRDSSMMHLADVATDLLRENHTGDPVTEDMLTVFNQNLQNAIQDRSRREMNLLRPVGDKLMLDFMQNNDPVGQAKSLALNTSRKAAMAQFGRITNDFEIQGALEAARLDGASPEEMEALKTTFDLLTGKHDQSDPELVQAMKDLTHAAYMGGQGFANLSDVSAMFGTLGMTGGIKAFGSTIRELLRHSENTPLMNQLLDVAAGTMGQDHRLAYIMPESDVTGAVDPGDAGRLGRVARRASQATSFLSFANRTNSAMHRAFVPQLAEHLTQQIRAGKEDVRLSDLGLDPHWLERCNAMLTKHDADRGVGQRINWDSWEDQAAAERMVSAIHRGTYQTIQKALLGERPAWAELTVVGRLAGQFRSFGLTAAEKQTARGLVGVQDAQVFQQAVVGLAWGGALMYARVNMQTLGMSEAERRKYLDRRLGAAEVTAGVLNFWNISGLATDIGGAAMAMTGASPARGSGIAALDWAGRALRAPGKLAEGDLAGGARGVVPMGNTIPMLMLMNMVQE